MYAQKSTDQPLPAGQGSNCSRAPLVIDAEVRERAQHIHAQQQRRLAWGPAGLEHPVPEDHLEAADVGSAELQRRNAAPAPGWAVSVTSTPPSLVEVVAAG